MPSDNSLVALQNIDFTLVALQTQKNDLLDGKSHSVTLFIYIPFSVESNSISYPQPQKKHTSNKLLNLHSDIARRESENHKSSVFMEEVNQEIALVTQQLERLSHGWLNKLFGKKVREKCIEKIEKFQRKKEAYLSASPKFKRPSLAIEVSSSLLEVFDQFSRSLLDIESADGKWLLTSTPDKHFTDSETLTSRLTHRNSICAAKSGFPSLFGAQQFPSIASSNFTIIFHPAFLIWHAGDQYSSLIAYEDLHIIHHEALYVDTAYQPADAKLINITYRFSKSNGDPDRRYKDNAALPIYRYSRFQLITKTGLYADFVLSNTSKGEAFFKALSDLCDKHHLKCHKNKTDHQVDTARKEQAPHQLFAFQYLSLPSLESPPINAWYKYQHNENTNFFNFNRKWERPWKMLLNDAVSVAGISFNNRARDLLQIINLPDFRLTFEKEPTNPHSKFAIKIIAVGESIGGTIKKHIGYLPDDLATDVYDMKIDLRPRSIFLPLKPDEKLGLRVDVLFQA